MSNQVVIVPASLLQQAAAGAEALRILQERDRERALLAAQQEGRIAASDVDSWRHAYNANPAAACSLLSSLTASSSFPSGATEDEQYDAVYRRLFGEAPPTR